MIPLFKVWMAPDAKDRVAKVLDSGYIGQGPVVEEFEAALARRCGTGNVLTTSSGTAALDLALACLNVGPGDEVISTPMTCSATNHAINNRGATIVWADINPISGLIDPVSVTQRITDRTKAVVVVDWAGEMVRFELGLRRRDLPIIVDSAHRAPSVDHRFRPESNTWMAYSFQAIKFLTCGDGGALVVPDAFLERARKARWFGLDRRAKSDFRCDQRIDVKGSKWHMNDISAAIGLANLEGLDDRVARHIRCGETYPSSVARPSHHWVRFIHVNDRSAFQSFMGERGVATSLVHSRNDLHPVFESAKQGPLGGLEKFDKSYVGVPCGWWLSDDDAVHIANSVEMWERQHGRPE